ncbi:MFS transporter [Nevskia sp.]|uniref:MFS transporter n=1 Tax=Nevskia sp. TaxID=1929292 RepID=UPI0025DF420E|nr:MFS transporter [Nevskia sp.]
MSDPTASPPASTDAFAALRFPEYRNLIGGSFLFTIAITIQEIAIAYELYLITRDPLVLGLLGLAEALPFIAVALYGGHVADRHDKRRIMLLALAFIFSGSVFLTWLTLPSVRAGLSQTALLAGCYGVVAAFGLARGFLTPAVSSLKAFLVPREHYANASAWSSTAWQAGAILGPMVGGFLYAGAGLTTSLIVVCGLLLLQSVMYLRIKPRPPADVSTGDSVWQSLGEGLRFVWQSKIILYSISLDLFSVLFGGVVAILPIFAEDVLKIGAEGLGILRAAPAVGALLTVLVLTRYPPMRHAWRNLLIAVAGFGVSILVFGVSRNLWLSAAALCASGAFDSISVVVRSTILQMMPPDHLRGRVLSVNSIFISSSNELGAFQAGTSAAIFGATRSVLIGGGITLGIVAWVWRRSGELLKLRLDRDAQA